MARDAIISGSLASVLSTLAISCCSRWQAGAASAGTNAISHWVWGDRAKHEDRLSLRHTAVGYAIHHASSAFWAVLFECATRRVRRTPAIAAAAATTAAIAYLVDYHAVPYRLRPGFRSRLSPGAMFATYTAFAVGLGVGGWMRARRHRPAS